jgi:hypothetical protein
VEAESLPPISFAPAPGAGGFDLHAGARGLREKRLGNFTQMMVLYHGGFDSGSAHVEGEPPHKSSITVGWEPRGESALVILGPFIEVPVHVNLKVSNFFTIQDYIDLVVVAELTAFEGADNDFRHVLVERSDWDSDFILGVPLNF